MRAGRCDFDIHRDFVADHGDGFIPHLTLSRNVTRSSRNQERMRRCFNPRLVLWREATRYYAELGYNVKFQSAPLLSPLR